MPGLIYDAGQNGLWVFVLVTVAMGGATAYVTGKAVAETWRPFWQVIAYALLIGLVARFIHFALFEEVLLSARNYLVDCGVMLACAVLGYHLARRRQFSMQYGWRTQQDGAEERPQARPPTQNLA